MPEPQPRHTALSLTLLVFVVALLPRIVGLGWGLPYVEHADEPAVVEVAMRMVQQGDWNPGMFLYPSLYFYQLALVIQLHLAWGINQGLYTALADVPSKTYQFTTAPTFYIWARALTALLGSLTMPLLFQVGRRMFGWPVGLLAAIGLALSSYHIEHSHFITTDVPTGLWVTLALMGIWGVATSGQRRDYLLAGIATGLAAGTKYNAGVVGLTLGVATALYLADARRVADRPAWRRLVARHTALLLAAGTLALLVFLATTPFAVLDFATFRRDMQINLAHYSSGSHGNFIGRWRLDGYLAFFWQKGLMAPGCLLLLAGLPLLIRRTPRQFSILSTAILSCGGLLLTQAVNFNRNTLPFFPPLFLLLAAATVELAEWIGTRIGVQGAQMTDHRAVALPQTRLARRAGGLALILLATLLIVPQFLDTAWLLAYWSKPHTLVQAAAQLRAQPRGMLAAVETNAVQWAGDPAVQPMNFIGAHGPEWYRARGYRYLLLNSEHYGPEVQTNYDRLRDGGVSLLTMPPRDLGQQPGPGGALIDLGEQLERLPFIRTAAHFGDAIALLGYEIRPGDLRSRITPLEGAAERVLTSGQPVQINLYWRAIAVMKVDYTLFIHLYDRTGNRVAQRDLPLRYADYPTSRWQPGELVIDRADMPLPALPSGDYTLRLGLYDATTGVPLASAGGAPVTLTTISVR